MTEAWRGSTSAEMWTEIVKLRARAEAAEARIDAALAQLDAGAPTSWGDAAIEGFDWLAIAVRAALAEPVEPQPSACATCGGTGTVWIAERDRIRPCPSCTPPDPVP